MVIVIKCHVSLSIQHYENKCRIPNELQQIIQKTQDFKVDSVSYWIAKFANVHLY